MDAAEVELGAANKRECTLPDSRSFACIRGHLRKWSAKNNALPLDLRFLEIDQEATSHSRGPQIVQALRQMFLGETVDAFNLKDQGFLNENIGEKVTDELILVNDGERCLRYGLDTPEM